jgi:DNA-binding CsgD family transcriptional regulator
MDSSAPDDLLIDRIYEAAVSPDRWDCVLGDIARFGGAAGGGLFVQRHDAWAGWRQSAGMPDPSDYIARGLAARSITTPRLMAAGRPGFMADHTTFDPEEYDNDPFVTHWIGPSGFHHGAATGIQLPNGDAIVVQVLRKRGAPPFETDSIARLDNLRPHIARSAMLASRWRLEQIRTAVQALDLVGLPAAVVGPGGRVAAANASFESLTRFITWLADGRFRFSSTPASDILSRHVTDLNRGGEASAGSFAVQDRAGGPPAVAHFIPARGDARDLFGGGRALLVITPLGLRARLDVDLVQTLFDLTPAEAKVAASLVQGRSIAQIAAMHSVSVDTVRAQVKSVMAKSGASRQAEFIAQVGEARLEPPRNP